MTLKSQELTYFNLKTAAERARQCRQAKVFPNHGRIAVNTMRRRARPGAHALDLRIP
jgi:hypothetical protein